MTTIRSLFADNPRNHIAAQYVETKVRGKFYYDLYYCALPAGSTIPPSVYVWAYMQSRRLKTWGKMVTNFTSWVSTYSVKETELKTFGRNSMVDDKYDELHVISTLATAPWSGFSLTGLGPKPNLTSLYEERLSSGESKARRLYLLAAFSILKKYGRVNYGQGRHNIGSLLVSNTGEILSWGVNTGGFCHAEVNTLLSYFAKNPTETTLPAKSVLFSTLKPCAMCSTFIKHAQHRGSDVKVWYGMIDEGGSGGTPLLGENSTIFKGEDIVELDVFELLSAKGTLESATIVKGTKPVLVNTRTGKVDLVDKLNKSGGGHGARGRKRMSAADWVDDSAEVWNLVEAAFTKLHGKAGKVDREAGPKKAVLDYIKAWAKP